MNAPNVPTFHGQTSSGQGVLLPARTKERRSRSLLVEISSRDRNIRTHPSTSQFRWRFQRPLKDILSIQLVGGTIPTRFYNIDVGWNTFFFKERLATYTITIPPGLYTLTQLTTVLTTLLNAISGLSNTYRVYTTDTSDCLITQRLTGTANFGYLFADADLYDLNNCLTMMNSPARMMGFMNDDYEDTSGILISPNAADVDFLLNRIYLFLNHDNNQDLGTIERTVGKPNPHAIIYMDTKNPYKTFTKDVFQPLFVSSPAPVARLTTLDINLTDEWSRPINLQGRDITLTLEVVYLE